MSLDWIAQDLLRPRNLKTPRVSRSDYESWSADFLFDSLRNQRYGQSFCAKFGVYDYSLFYCRSIPQADRHIRKHYVTRNQGTQREHL